MYRIVLNAMRKLNTSMVCGEYDDDDAVDNGGGGNGGKTIDIPERKREYFTFIGSVV